MQLPLHKRKHHTHTHNEMHEKKHRNTLKRAEAQINQARTITLNTRTHTQNTHSKTHTLQHKNASETYVGKRTVTH